MESNSDLIIFQFILANQVIFVMVKQQKRVLLGSTNLIGVEMGQLSLA